MNTLEERILWFNKYFINVMYDEGWFISSVSKGEESYYTVQSFLDANGKYLLNWQCAINNARDYGWIINDDGIILTFDINELKKNKHLITGIDLGLL